MVGGRIKGITVEIGGDTTKLQTALKGVNSEIRNTQSQLKDVEKLLKLDPGNMELLAQKHRLLGDAVAETKEKLETLKTAAEQANDALARGDISQEQYDALQREIVETENALKDLEAQAGQSEVALQKLAESGGKLQALGDNIAGVGEKLLPVTAAVTGLGTVAVKTAADFDSGMSKVAAISGATGNELDALRDKAREMGSKTKFSASEAASAMEYMAMAGWKTEDMLGGIEGIMNLAAASGEDLATTSDIVTDALTAFGLSASDSGHFADVLAAASSNANTNVSMMGETFKYAAPIAGALGFSVEDTATAIGLMANAGIKGSQAGTALRAIMNNLAGEVKLCGESLGEVTIQTTNADGSMRELSDILADCRGAFSQLSESEQASAAEALVGKNAMSGFLAIMNAGEADINKLSSAIANCDGTSQSMADTMQDNLSGQLTILKSQLEELAISFGEMLMPVIRDVVSWIQGFVDKLNSMDEGTRKTIITIAAVAAAIGPVLIIVGKVISAVGTIMTIIPKISGAIKAVKGAFAGLNAVLAANPIILIIAAVAALVAAFIYLWNNCEEFREFWINLWENVKEIAVAVWNGIKDFFIGLWEGISSAATSIWNGISGFFSGVWNGIRNTAQSSWGGIKSGITSTWDSIKGTASTVWNGISSTVSTVTDAVGSTLRSKWDSIIGAYEAHGGGLTGIASGAMEAIKGYFTLGFDAVNNITGGKLDGIKAKFEETGEKIESFLSNTWQSISSTVQSVWTGICSTVTSILGSIQNAISTAWNNAKNTVSGVMNAIHSNVTSIWNNIRSGVSSTVNGIVTAIQTGFNTAVNYIRNLISQAFTWGRDLIMGIVNGIQSSVSAVGDAVSGVANTIRSWLHFSVPDVGPLRDYESWMPDFMGGLARGIEKSRGLIKDAVGNVAEDLVITPTLMGGSSIMTDAGAKTAEGNGMLVSLLGQYLPYLPQLANLKVVTDTGALVGELAPQMDEQLGILALRQRRQ